MGVSFKLSISSLSHKDWLKLVSGVTNLRDRLIFEILYSTGCSESELISLKSKDIFLKNRIIKFGKRQAIISHKTSLLISSYLSSEKPTLYLFFSRQSSQLTPKRIQQIVREESRTILGKSLKPLDIRYSHIYHALLKNVSIVSMAKQTGLSYQRLAQIIEEISTKNKGDLEYGYEL